jgi:phage terminase large subunit-like protein
MIRDEQVIVGSHTAELGSNRLLSAFQPSSAAIFGKLTPRIHTPLNDLPSKGPELIDLATSIGVEMMEWQKFALIHSHKVKPDGRWATPLNVVTVARQNGKSFLMQLRILGGLFLWDEPLQIGSAHRLATSLEQFRQLVNLIESSDTLSKQVRRIRWSHGSEEIETDKGNRFIVKAGGSAARGVSAPSTLHLDELREMHDMESFASLRYTLMASKNPMVMAYTNAGDSHSVVLNQLRDRGLAAAAGANDDIGYFEWSSPTDEISLENAAWANPSLGVTIHPDNLRAVFNDPPEVVMTEVLCRWTLNMKTTAEPINKPNRLAGFEISRVPVYCKSLVVNSFAAVVTASRKDPNNAVAANTAVAIAMPLVIALVVLPTASRFVKT